jgi:hypothetical protein
MCIYVTSSLRALKLFNYSAQFMMGYLLSQSSVEITVSSRLQEALASLRRIFFESLQNCMVSPHVHPLYSLKLKFIARFL